MAANTSPIFLATPAPAWVSTGTSANTNLDGTGTVATVLTAGANGTKIERVILQHLGSNVATVVRLFLNNGSVNSTPSNNTLVAEVALAANTLSQVAASVRTELSLDIAIPSGYKLNCTTGTAIASGVQVSALAGNY